MPYKNTQVGDSKTVTRKVIQQSQFYRGFSTVNTQLSDSRLFDFDLIQQDIINHFNTKKGERVMNPTFGTIIWDLLMEPLTEEVRIALKKDIETICNFDPRVTPTQIDMTEYDNGYILEITLLLNGTDQSANLRLTFDQKIGLRVQ